MAGDTETGVTIHETVKELDAGPIAAQQGFLIRPDDDAGTVYERAAELAAELLDEVLADPVFRPQEGEASYAEKIEPDDRILDLSRPVEEPEPNSRTLAAHRCARRAAGAAGHDLAGAARGRRARAGGSPARGRAAHAATRTSSAACVSAAAPAWRPTTFSGVCSRRAPTPTARSAPPRKVSTSATARSRGSSPTAPCSACGRSITRSRRSGSARCASSIRRCWRRCGSARTSSAISAGSRATPR